jgi:hypothetical protein
MRSHVRALQAALELVCLLNQAHFLPPCRFRFKRILLHQPATRPLASVPAIVRCWLREDFWRRPRETPRPG